MKKWGFEKNQIKLIEQTLYFTLKLKLNLWLTAPKGAKPVN